MINVQRFDVDLDLGSGKSEQRIRILLRELK